MMSCWQTDVQKALNPESKIPSQRSSTLDALNRPTQASLIHLLDGSKLGSSPSQELSSKGFQEGLLELLCMMDEILHSPKHTTTILLLLLVVL